MVMHGELKRGEKSTVFVIFKSYSWINHNVVMITKSLNKDSYILAYKTVSAVLCNFRDWKLK
jgi:hypothetical protein